MPRPTIADVARAAGVSKSTVSRVLNGNTDYVRSDTLERVAHTIAEMGYRPNAVARSLVSKRTHTAGLLISDVGNPFYSEVIRGVEDIALAHGYDVFLCNTSYDLARGMTFVRSLADKQVDGVLIMSSSMSDELVLELAKHQVPVVVLDWQLSAVEGIVGAIAVDFTKGISAAAAHLVDLGHRRLAHVSGPLHLRTSGLRRDPFLAALAERGIDPAQVIVVEGNLRIDGGRRALAELLAIPNRPTAVFAANDLMAIGIAWAARDHGLRVPEDLSVIGLDDIQLAAELTPPLTTVALPRYELGSLAMGMLLDLLEGSHVPQAEPICQSQVETHLVVRQSTARTGG
jgi:LacI family transcriptional regulator